MQSIRSRTTRPRATSGGSSPGSSPRSASRPGRSGSRIPRSRSPRKTPPSSPASSPAERGRLFRVGLYVTVRAPSEETLEREVHRVRAVCASLLLDTRPVTFRALQGWITTLPLGMDALRLRRTFDTKALAAAFPFASAVLEASGGVFLGRNATTGGLVFVDRFALENHNQVVLARSGAGKSYLAKLQVLRSLYEGIEVLVIDPENEYRRLAHAVGGVVVSLGGSGERLNPLDLAEAGTPEALTDQALFVHTLVSGLLGEVSAEEKAALDRAILAAYEAAGIATDPRTHARPAPVLADVAARLRWDPLGLSLAGRLDPYVSGSHRSLFDGPATVRADGHLVVFSLRDLPGGAQDRGDAPCPRCRLAQGRAWRAPTPGRGGGRGLVAPGGGPRCRCPVPSAAREVGPQALVRPHRDHPGRGRCPFHRARAGRSDERREPGAPRPVPAGDGGPRPGLQPVPPARNVRTLVPVLAICATSASARGPS